ncbi:hypothetical protein LXL04_025551 [Taraxacum kok-saghyz]
MFLALNATNISAQSRPSHYFLFLFAPQSPYLELKHNRSSSEGNNCVLTVNNGQNKENSEPNKVKTNSDPVVDKENVDSNIHCMQLDDPIPNFGSSFYEPIDSGKNNFGNIWDYSEAAPTYDHCCVGHWRINGGSVYSLRVKEDKIGNML